MAQRPVFIPTTTGTAYVVTKMVDFEWHRGQNIAQARKNVAALHESAHLLGVHPVLEISTRSLVPAGVGLSALNLTISWPDLPKVAVECLFQASKVFAGGGPYLELLQAKPADAKRDPRLRESGPLVGFSLAGQRWPTKPITAFYDWIYLNALDQNRQLASDLLQYSAFTDISFNPKRSLNCQARAAALYAALVHRDELRQLVCDREAYLRKTKLLSSLATGDQGQLF